MSIDINPGEESNWRERTMPLQTPRLRMYALGISGDPPSDEVRHHLSDGIHLRWFFERNLGFPRHGFYVFRRPSIAGAEQRCLHEELDRLPSGPLRAAFLDTSLGRIESDSSLHLSDEFDESHAARHAEIVWVMQLAGF